MHFHAIDNQRQQHQSVYQNSMLILISCQFVSNLQHLIILAWISATNQSNPDEHQK